MNPLNRFYIYSPLLAIKILDNVNLEMLIWYKFIDSPSVSPMFLSY